MCLAATIGGRRFPPPGARHWQSKVLTPVFISSLLAKCIMSIRYPRVNRRLLISALSLLLGACNSSYFSVKKSELTALEQCQQTQQAQQVLLAQQQARLDETLSLLQEGLELQKRQAETPPPPIEQGAPATVVRCPQPPKTRTPTLVNPEAVILDKQIVGERERVLLNAVDVVLRARINTGLATSQLDARDIQLFERNGEEWVRFSVVDPATDTLHELERKRLRYSTTSRDERRPIVELRLTIGKITQNAELVLVDRSGQPYPLLIGRNILRDVMLVDVSRSDIAPVAREPKETATKEAPAKETSRP